MSHERVGDEEIEIAGRLPVGQELTQFLVLARTRGKGVRANTPHARNGLRDQRRHLLLVQLAPLAGEILERGRIDTAQSGLRGEHGAQQRGPPREVELGVNRAVIDVAIDEVLSQLVETAGGEALAHLKARGHFAGGGGVAGPALNERGHALQVGAHQVRFLGGEHGGDRVKVITHRVGQGRDLTDLCRENGPRVLAAHRTPRVAALLDTDEGAVQVRNVHAGTHEVLGLLDEAVALRPSHRNVVFLAPLLGGGCNDHVGCTALEYARLEDVKDICDAIEHGKLAVPLRQGSGGLNAGLTGDRSDVDTQFGQGLGESVNAQQHVRRLLVGGQDRIAPRGRGGTRECAGGDGLAQECSGTLTLVHGNVVEGLFGEANARRGCVLTARQVRQSAQGIGRADPEAAVWLVQGDSVGRQSRANLTQAGTHRVHTLLVNDRGGIIHGARHASRQSAPGIGVAVDVRDDVSQTEVGEARVRGDRARGRRRHMQDGTARRGRISENRRDHGGVVTVGRNVNEDTMSVGGRFDGVLLDGDEVANTLFRPRVTVAGVGLVRVGTQIVASVLVTRERANDSGIFERGHVFTEAGCERGCGVTEQADDELVANIEARQRRA